MKKWAMIFILLAALDVLFTHISLSLGSIEANPLVRGLDIQMVALVKMVSYLSIAYLCVRFKLKTLLILGVGANAGIVAANLMAIWTLKTM